MYVDEWVSQVSKMLHEGGDLSAYRIDNTEKLKEDLYNHTEELLGKLMSSGVKCLDDFFSRVSEGEGDTGGYIVVLQTHGRSGQV